MTNRRFALTAAAAMATVAMLAGCANGGDASDAGTPVNTATASPSTDNQPASDRPTSEPTASTVVEVQDGDGSGHTGEAEAAAFGENADASLVADEMRRFTEQALANQDLMSNKVDLDEEFLNRLGLSGRALAYVTASRDHALELTIDTFNGENVKPRAVNGRFADLVDSDDMQVDSHVIKENGQPVALHAEWDATVRVYVKQRTDAKAAWKNVTYEGTRHYSVRLVLNPVKSTEEAPTSVWLVDDWETTDVDGSKNLRFKAVAAE